MARQFAPGALIWIKDDETVWRSAEIISVGEQEIIVRTSDSNEQLLIKPTDPVFIRNVDQFTSEGLVVMDDLTQLTHLHEPAVLHSLQLRFDTDKIYTFTGPILIAVNPFKNIHTLYHIDTLKSYIKPSSGEKLKPHVFSISQAAFRGVCDRQRPQTVLISGESGAGKTETTKFVMKFLALAGAGDDGVTQIERQVLESNPLLEAFGNARTLRNDNSSRFGKFIEMQFEPEKKGGAKPEAGQQGPHHRLCGARIRTYLLERVRITEQQEGERNYHFFYQLCAAATAFPQENDEYNFPQLIKVSGGEYASDYKLDLKGCGCHSNFRFLNFSSCYQLKDVNEVEQFERTIAAMKTIGIQDEEIQNIIYCTSAVLNLGNADFVAPPGNSEASTISDSSKESFEIAARLLGKSAKELEEAICYKTIVTRDGKLRSHIKVNDARDVKDALSRNLYGLMFLRIVARANQAIGFLPEVSLFVGVLDIFGFECFKVNSFEQLCINFTNERLQQFFNNFVFKLEEELYKNEGIPWDPLDFPDNQDSVDILGAARIGIFSMLDEECAVPQGSEQGFVNKLIKQYKDHRRFDNIKTKPNWFIVKHFAGPVPYSSDGFLDKNKDQLSLDCIHAMKESTNPWFAELFLSNPKFSEEPADNVPGRKKKIATVSSEFKEQLNGLMALVETTDPHFIRCIKPNPMNLADVYDRPSVCEQLRYGGVLQVVQVSRAGYPVRFQHQDAWDDFRILLNRDDEARIKKTPEALNRIKQTFEVLDKDLNMGSTMKQAGGVSWAVGKTMVFFKQGAFELISQLRLKKRGDSATTIQAPFRRWRQQKLFHMYKACAVHLQALLHSKAARDKFDLARKQLATLTIQKKVRQKLEMWRYREKRRKIISIQALVRGHNGRKRAKTFRLDRAATKIQSWYRGLLVHRLCRQFLPGIRQVQKQFKINVAKKLMRERKKDQQDLGKTLVKLQKQNDAIKETQERNKDLENKAFRLINEAETQEKKIAALTSAAAKHEEEMEKLRQAAATQQVIRQGSLIVESEEMDALKLKITTLEETVTARDGTIEEMKQIIHKMELESVESAKKYDALLRGITWSSGALPQDGGVARHPAANKSQRTVDIQFVGASKVGKTALFENFARHHPDTASKLARNREQGDMPIMGRYEMEIGDQILKILDCSGNDRAKSHIRGYFPRSQWVFIVYDLTKRETFAAAKDLLLHAVAAQAQVVLFGNKYQLEAQGGPASVDVKEAKDFAASNSAFATEANNIDDPVAMIMQDLFRQDKLEVADEIREKPERSSGANWLPWGNKSDRGSKNLAFAGVLTPSLKGTQNMKKQRKDGELSSELRPVQELQDSESAVTCICFGQERLHRQYILLAAASKDGTVVIYRCYRTEMEIAMLGDSDLGAIEDLDGPSVPPDHSNIAVHSRLVGHTRAITSIFFNLLEDQLVTTSIDKSVRFWSVDSGEMLKVFTDSSPVPVASFLPFNPQVFVAANSNAVLRLVNVQNGMVLQKLKVETEVRALKFDDTGLFLLAGTKNGSIHVLEASDSNTLKFKFKAQLARGGVTCITFVKQQPGNPNPPCLLVNTSDSSVAIVDCTYGPPAGVLTNLTVRHRVKVAHSLLPLKNCYSPSGNGYLISGSEDKEVYIYSLARGGGYKMQFLKHHQVPVVAVANNHQDTLLASADSLGRIVLWRRMDFSHLPD